MPGFSYLLQQLVIDLRLNQLVFPIVEVMATPFDTFIYAMQQPCSIPVLLTWHPARVASDLQLSYISRT